jgi:HTH-type transcriptional repressor of NAD biosynthesis genes
MRRVGVTIGKFMPLHKGHELMIEFGAAMMDELQVVVSGNETDLISLTTRYNWVRQFVYEKRLNNVGVHLHIDKSPTPINIDKDGTVLDVDFQYYWANVFTKIDRRITHIVSSDKYGQAIADRMNLEWLPVDPGREMVEISATKIRKDPTKYFKYISDVAKPYYVKKVAIVGPESTGKSTLVKSLGKFLNGSIVHEYGRTVSEAKKNNLNADDFLPIARGQQALIDIAVRNAATPLVVIDTEALTTYLFSKIYLDSPKDIILDFAADQEIDLYVVLAPTVAWVDDGTRVAGNQADREQFFEDLVGLLEHNKRQYIIVDETDYVLRQTQAATGIYNFVNQRLTQTQTECINNM